MEGVAAGEASAEGRSERWKRWLPMLLSTALATVPLFLTYAAARSLPVLADGALHSQLIEEMADGGSLWTATVSNYPPLYHVFGAQLYLLAGQAGIQLISPIALALASLLMFLIVRELTGNTILGLLTQLLLAFSPVLIFYSSVALMEPLLVATTLFAAYALLLLARRKSGGLLVLAAVAVASAALTKQVGLVMPIVAVAFMLATGAGLRRTGILAVVVTLLVAGPYLFLFLRADSIASPGPVPPTTMLERSGGPVGWVRYGTRWHDVPDWSWELDTELDTQAVYAQGTLTHERRHVYWYSLGDWSKFVSLHTLYPKSFFGYRSTPRPWVLTLLNVSMALGLLTAFALAVRSPPWRVIVLLLLISYPVMTIGSDTKRYFLYLSVIAAPFPFLPYWVGYRWLQRALAGRARVREVFVTVAPGIAAGLVVVLLTVIYSMGIMQVRATDGLRETQGGFVSAGGNASLRATAEWLQAHSAPDEGYMAASSYEWEYYSNRPDLWWEGLDYRLYFLPPERVDHYLRAGGARYVVIRDNQLVSDDAWEHIELVPLSFQATVRGLYPEVYVSPYGDIRVYEVATQEASS